MLTQLETNLQDKIHIFSSFFYRRLTSAKLTSKDGSKTGYEMVKSWTRKLNLFEKDFVIVPINENLHWFLAIICHPSRMLADIIEDTKSEGADDEKANGPDTTKEDSMDIVLSQESQEQQEQEQAQVPFVDLDPEPVESTKIYIFDSLGLASRGKGLTVINKLRTYLQLEAEDKLKRATNKSSCHGHVVKVPQQENYTDCGCFLLQFAEEFFKGIPSNISNKIEEEHNDMSDWFPSSVAQCRRELMRKRVEQLAHDYAERENLRFESKPQEEHEDRSSDIEEIIMLPSK